jgi:transcriptional regulator with XRE-family HTH domain
MSRPIAYRRRAPLAEARPVLAHLERLERAGVGWRRAADTAGIPRSTVHQLIYGRAGRPPQLRLRAAAAAALLEVTPRNAAPAWHTDATGAGRRLRALVATGWPVRRVASLSGLSARTAYDLALGRRATVGPATAARVAAAYDRLWAAPPPARTPQDAAAVARARRYAAERGWPPPLAWDDDEIDNPRARPKGLRPARALRCVTARIHTGINGGET